MHKTKLILLLYILGLQVLDIITTYLAIMNGAKELNPLVGFLLDKWPLLLFLKIVVGIFVYICADKKLLVIYSIIMVQAIITNIWNAII